MHLCLHLFRRVVQVRRKTVSKEAVYITVDIREDGSSEGLTSLICISQKLLTELKECSYR